MRAIGLFAMAHAVVLAVAGCGGGATQRSAATALNDMEQVRGSAGAREGHDLAPQAFGHAEQHRELARRAEKAGDDTAAGLHAERAMAAYNHSLVLARVARAEQEIAQATQALAESGENARKLAASRVDVEHEADELEKKVRIAREMLLPAPTGPADPQREAARRVAARALGTQARLLCGAARLVSPAVPGLAEAEQDLTELDKKLDATTGAAPIDAAARARAACLALLTRSRRATDAGATGQADALLTELAAAGGWDPSRDERGVVITLRGVWSGTQLTPQSEAKLKELARVAAAHPGFAVQVVVHDASATEASTDAQRAEAIVKALVAAGVPAAKVKGEAASAHAPVVDPADAKNRPRNARVEIVFVAPSN